MATSPVTPVEPASAEKPPLVAGVHSRDALKVGDLKERRRSPLQTALDVFLPNRAVSPPVMAILIGVEALIALLVWINSPFAVLPRPSEVLAALRNLWMTQGLGQELMTSFVLNLEALGWSTLLALGLAYLTVLSVFRPLVAALSKGRFLSLVGFSLIFTLITGGGHALKTSLLVWGITAFYLTSMASVIAAIPRAEFDYARTLRMSEWRVVWEVVILGTLDKAFEVLRQNAAIGWLMLTLVEGIVRSEGGIGAMLLAQSKYMRLADVFAIQLIILATGMGQDYAIGFLRRLCCPYADLSLERK